MTEKLLPCPFCGGEAFVATVEHPKENRPNEYRFHGQIMCYKCQATAGTTGFDLTHEEATKKAIAAWNSRTQPENEPLTLSELRGMGGEPVWIQESAPYTFAGYKILCSPVVDEYEDVCFEGGDCYYSNDYGKTWLAYRTKPERSEG